MASELKYFLIRRIDLIAKRDLGTLVPGLYNIYDAAIPVMVEAVDVDKLGPTAVSSADTSVIYLYNIDTDTLSTGGGGVGGSGTPDVLVTWLDANNLTDGTWALSGNNIYPLTDGGNIGIDDTNTVGTIFINGGVDYPDGFTFKELGVEMARIATGGLFGLGTDTPTAKAHIVGDTTSENYALKIEDNIGGVVLYVKDDGRVYIGATPSSDVSLYVKGKGDTDATYVLQLDNGNAEPLVYAGDSGGVVFYSQDSTPSNVHVEFKDASGTRNFFILGTGEAAFGWDTPQGVHFSIQNKTGQSTVFDITDSTAALGLFTVNDNGYVSIGGAGQTVFNEKLNVNGLALADAWGAGRVNGVPDENALFHAYLDDAVRFKGFLSTQLSGVNHITHGFYAQMTGTNSADNVGAYFNVENSVTKNIGVDIFSLGSATGTPSNYGARISLDDGTDTVVNNYGIHITTQNATNNYSLFIVSGDVVIQSPRVNIANLPTSAAGLASGDLWSNLGIITMVP